MKIGRTPEEIAAEVDRAIEESEAQARVDYENRGRREMKACKRCGHQRKVLLHFTWFVGQPVEVSWALYCTACMHLRNAEKYERFAEKNRRQAQEIFNRRAESVQEAFATKVKKRS